MSPPFRRRRIGDEEQDFDDVRITGRAGVVRSERSALPSCSLYRDHRGLCARASRDRQVAERALATEGSGEADVAVAMAGEERRGSIAAEDAAPPVVAARRLHRIRVGRSPPSASSWSLLVSRWPLRRARRDRRVGRGPGRERARARFERHGRSLGDRRPPRSARSGRRGGGRAPRRHPRDRATAGMIEGTCRKTPPSR